MSNGIIFDLPIDWTGENPGIYLKDDPSGPWTTLASFFRIYASPKGPGTALLLLASPTLEFSAEQAPNVCITDNEPLARWLVNDFAAHFEFFRNTPSIPGINYLRLDSSIRNGDALNTYSETVSGGGHKVRLDWSGLGTPFGMVVPPESAPTGKHTFLSMFVGAKGGTVTLNGAQLPGQPIPRDAFGRQITSAFLAFSEIWMRHT
tara:strand:- start:420 stop:1034 length:615 start_codon:yes stop_codon:yes gene_type:complete